MREDDGSERKRCTLLFGGLLRRMSEHMDVLKSTMSKLMAATPEGAALTMKSGAKASPLTVLFPKEQHTQSPFDILRRMSEHMDVLKGTMSKLCRDLQNFNEDKEWYQWGLVHGGRAAIEYKAAVLRADAVERAVHYDSDTTGYYDSEPEVVLMWK